MGSFCPRDRGSERPQITYSRGGAEHRLECDFIAGCDSNYITQLLHDLYEGKSQEGLQLARFEYLGRSRAAATSLPENYTGLPAAPDC